MSRPSIGIALARKGGSLAVVESDRKAARLLFEHHVPRTEGTGAARTLAELLEALPAEWRKVARVSIALSASDCATADVWELPAGFRGSALAKLLPALTEARSAGDNLEELAIHGVTVGGTVRAIALRNELLGEIRTALASAGLKAALVTSIPAALADAFSGHARLVVPCPGETVELLKRDGRAEWSSFPVDGASQDPGVPLTWKGASVPLALAPAFAAAVARAESVPDALRGAPDAARGFAGRLRSPLLGVGGAAALLLLALGIRFETDRAHSAAILARARMDERGLWKKHLPDEPAVEGGFLRALKTRLKASGESPDESSQPSALDLWCEIGKRLPEVEGLGLTLESLDLSPEGARLVAAVAAPPEERLRHASLLERSLNAGDAISASGDFEARERDVQVRLRIARQVGAGQSQR